MRQLRWLGTLFLCSALASLAQQSPAPTPPVTLIPRSHEERESRYRAQHHIILNVVVTDASGKPVTGLGQEDFTLLDDGKPQTIASFRAREGSPAMKPAQPAHVLLMLDTVNNTSRGIANDRKEIEKFLKESPAHLANPTSIVILFGSGMRMSQLSSDRDTLIAELKEFAGDLRPIDCADDVNQNQAFLAAWMPGGGSGGQSHTLNSSRTLDCLNQRFERSIVALNKLAQQQVDVPARVILIWIGPGWPLLSSHEFRPDSAQIRQNFFRNLVELSTVLREAQVTLNVVSSPDLFRKTELRSDHDNAFFDGVPSEDNATAGSLGLEVLAHQSGGQILTQGKDIPSEIAHCIADDQSYYALSFDSPPATTTPGEFHPLLIKVNKPGLTVRTTTSYYAQP
jgi:VWFA-related protein